MICEDNDCNENNNKLEADENNDELTDIVKRIQDEVYKLQYNLNVMTRRYEELLEENKLLEHELSEYKKFDTFLAIHGMFGRRDEPQEIVESSEDT